MSRPSFGGAGALRGGDHEHQHGHQHLKQEARVRSESTCMDKVCVIILSIRFSGSGRRFSVKTFGETLEERLELPAPKRRPSGMSQGKVGPRV